MQEKEAELAKTSDLDNNLMSNYSLQRAASRQTEEVNSSRESTARSSL